jgi:hypothetical protein
VSGADLTAARGARDADRDEDALALLDALHPGGPDLADAAHLALDLGRPALAARWWARSLALRPTDEVARLGLAAARWRLGDAPGVRAALAGVAGAPPHLLLAPVRPAR